MSPVSSRFRDTSQAVAFNIALAIVYAIVAKLGLALDAVSGFATLVWPPTGISLVAILILGNRMCPGVALGAFAANVWAGAPLTVALGIATGNTAEAYLGAFALGRVAFFRPSLARLRDVLTFIGLAAVASTLISATVGVASLWVGGIVPTEGAGRTWAAWWVGDLMGDLVMAPVLLTHLSRDLAPRESSVSRLRRAAESLSFWPLLLAVSALLFAVRPEPTLAPIWHPYTIFPLLIWAALRFGVRGASMAVFVVSGVAIAGAATGRGPFAGPHLAGALLELQAFMAIVATTTLVLGAVTEERRRALAMRESLIALAAHELKTPLTSLLLRIQKLARRLRDGTPPGANPVRDAEALEGLVKRIGRLVDDLLDVSRIAAENVRLDREDVDLAALAREVVGRLPESQQALIAIAGPEALTGRWDRLRVDQILTNLVSNALKYGEHKPVVVMVERVEERARLVVRDRGIGIAEKDLKRIFERFERAATKNVSGFGVGLWIVQQVVRSLDGTIDVTSRLGQGSTFVVELPLRTRES
jgi:signal transduction histidine kinase